MAGKPGRGGRVPKRSSERRRRNKDSRVDQVEPVVAAVAAPKANSRWHPIAKAWFLSLTESGQSRFFEPSDWAAARYVAEAMSRNLRQERISSVLFSAVWSAMAELLTTEGARRRVRMEIDRQPVAEGKPAGVTAIADYRKSLGA